ncbi:MAG: hypothetical protein AAF726_17850 [Planctomycetota bacterium]
MTDARPKSKRADRRIFALTLLLLLPLEVICAQSAFHTLGEIDHMVVWSGVVAGNLFALALAAFRPRAGAIAAVLVGLAIIPQHLGLIRRHSLVRHEATRIVAFAYEAKARSGAFPEDLAEFEYERPSVARYVQHYGADEEAGGFMVTYCVGTPTTSHWYTPKGGWQYYPD